MSMYPHRVHSRGLVDGLVRGGLRVGAFVVAISAMGVVACGSAPPAATAPTALAPATRHSSGTELERYFPLVDGHVYQYATEGQAEPGVILARVIRTEAMRGELRFGGRSRSFEYAADGVRVATTGGYLLKTPLAVGTTWKGEYGGEARILSANASIDVPAGHFEGCVQTLEERSGDRPAKYLTTYCPNTGIVVLEVQSGATSERAELKSYGPAYVGGPDGTQRIP